MTDYKGPEFPWLYFWLAVVIGFCGLFGLITVAIELVRG